MIACKALDLSGEVITTPFTFPAPPHALSWNRITPVFADIDPVSMTIDPAAVESLVTDRTTGILGVHIYGLPCAVEKLQAVAEKFALRVVYDAALRGRLGAELPRNEAFPHCRGRRVGGAKSTASKANRSAQKLRDQG